MKTFLLGLIIGLLIIPAIVFLHFRVGHPPVAVADQAYSLEKELVDVPLHARIDKEMPRSSPIEPSATNLETGAHIYRQQCAVLEDASARRGHIGAARRIAAAGRNRRQVLRGLQPGAAE